MKKRILLCVAVLVLITFSLSALDNKKWYVGVSGDYVYNMMVSSVGYRSDTSYENGHGFGVSVPVIYQFAPWLGLESGMRYVQKNYSWIHDLYKQSSNAYSDSEHIRNQFLEIPLTLNFSFGNGTIQSVTSVGGYLGFWLRSDRSGSFNDNAEIYPVPEDATLVSYNEQVQFSNVRDNRFEAGLLVKTGFLVQMNPVLFTLRGTFSLGLTDLNKNYQKELVSRYNNSITVEAGILVGFGGAK